MIWQALDTAARALALPVAAGIFLNQLDELFMDANYLMRGLHRRSRRRVSWKTLQAVPQKRIAILVPAWKEAEVIRQMLEHNIGSLDYDRGRYTIFCGTYRNDAETQREVDAAARRFSNVRKVVVPHDGPTSKADCLNWIYQGIVLDEQQHGGRYDILLMHDAEDVIHPLSLRLYSLLIPRHDFVQTPVFSLELGLHQGVAATYIDEFAEHHLKDMLVRERIGGLVPSAGVGSAFRREAFEEIARAHGQHPFNVESLTEDYEIGLKFRLAGKKVHFACRSLEGGPPGGRREEIIATREYFPGGFRASVRQRSRWILGIALQTWRQIGWKGSLPVLYCLWRDRKALLTNTLVLLAYLVAGYGVVRLAASAGGAAPAPDLGGGLAGQVLGLLFAFNLGAMVWRASMKAKLVGRLYGWGHALFSAPRLVLGNLISLVATARAVGSYVKHRITGAPLRWLKTAHVFPNVAALQAQRRRLGQLLVEEHGLPPQDLEEALALQQELGRPLGEILGVMGLVSDQDLARALAQVHEQQGANQDGLRPAERELADLPESEAERLGVVPLAGDRAATVRLAAQRPLDGEALRVLEQRYGGSVEIVAAPAGAVREARRRAYRKLLGDGRPLPAQRRSLTPDEVDARSIDRLGLGFCALYGLVPLAPGAGLRVIAAAHPVHPLVQRQLSARLGESVQIQPAEALDVDVALSVRECGADGEGHSAMCTMDMLEALEAEGTLDAPAAASARARLLGLPVTAASGSPLDLPLLPPELSGPHPITVRALDHQSLVLATPHPSPRLARALAALYPGWAIAWEVSLPEPPARSSLEEESPWNVNQFKSLTN
jgi:bacteriophage N4 adsorption protein B